MTKITGYAALTSAQGDDVLPVVDVHDTSMAATGTTKKITITNLLSALSVNALSAPYNVVADGVTDNTAGLQAAVTAAQTAGLPLILPTGTILTGTVNITANVTVLGQGRNATTLKLKNGANGYLLNFSGGGSSVTVDFRDFAVNGNAAAQTGGGCIFAAGSVQSSFERLHLFAAYDVCLWLYQISPGSIGHHNRVINCLFDGLNTVPGATQQGLRMQSSDENYVALCDFESWGGLPASPGAEPYAIKDWSGIQVITGNVFVGGQEAVRIQDSASTRVIGNTFDGPARAGIHVSGSKNVIMGNLFSNGSSASNGAYGQCEIDNSTSAVVAGNSFTVTTAGVVRNCVRELSASSTQTVVSGNVIDLSGGSLFGGNKAVELFGAASAARGNPGFNPVGPLAAPGVPATTVALPNPFPYDVSVYVTAGASTCAVTVGGTVMFTIAAAGTGTVRLAAAQSVTLTYTSAPTWKWAAD